MIHIPRNSKVYYWALPKGVTHQTLVSANQVGSAILESVGTLAALLPQRGGELRLRWQGKNFLPIVIQKDADPLFFEYFDPIIDKLSEGNVRYSYPADTVNGSSSPPQPTCSDLLAGAFRPKVGLTVGDQQLDKIFLELIDTQEAIRRKESLPHILTRLAQLTRPQLPITDQFSEIQLENGTVRSAQPYSYGDHFVFECPTDSRGFHFIPPDCYRGDVANRNKLNEPLFRALPQKLSHIPKYDS